MLVSITPEFYRCITCGSDLKQHINGKISYIPNVGLGEKMRAKGAKGAPTEKAIKKSQA